VTALLDAHLHLWDPSRFRYPWLAGVPALDRPFGPAALDTGGHRLTGVIFVEAGRVAAQAFDEVRWVEELGIRLLADHGFTADLCVRDRQLPEITDLVARVPQVTFVLDHLGKPAVRAGRLDPWREHLRRLAGHPNVVCKLSGLGTEADPARWRPGDLLPYLRHALAEFGPDRCLFGSDWPVATLATTYDRWVAVVLEALAGHPSAHRELVLSGTAARIYRLTP
jgi:L-fuconolactonase